MLQSNNLCRWGYICVWKNQGLLLNLVCVGHAVRLESLHVAIEEKLTHILASVCAEPQPGRIDGNTSNEIKSIRLIPRPQPVRSRTASVLMETQLHRAYRLDRGYAFGLYVQPYMCNEHGDGGITQITHDNI